jgi:hypothetical protein
MRTVSREIKTTKFEKILFFIMVLIGVKRLG